MFGNAPKAMWSRWIEADDQNRIPLACRCLLVTEDADDYGGDKPRRILFETGIGAFFKPDMRERYGVVESEHVLLKSLAAHGLSADDIDVIVLSHLHFDHAGGLLSAWQADADHQLVFPHARIIAGKTAWERAQAPHPRDRASFISELISLIESSGRLELVSGDHSPTLGAGYRFHYSDGHTPGLLLSEIDMPGGPVVFAADLIPGRPWVHAPITMGYDRYPELLINEKQRLLDDLHGRKGRLFFTHDAEVAMSTVSRDKRNRFVPIDSLEQLEGLSQ